MRLTLKRLLDYGEDRLSPEQTRELGQILAEHPDAAKLVEILEKAGKGPRLPRGEEETKIPLAQLALYLDDRMDPATELEFEKRAYRDPELLGEIARCHEALSRALPAPTLVGENDGEDGATSLAWPGGKLSLVQIQAIVEGEDVIHEDEEDSPGWKNPYRHLEKHILDQNPDRFGGLEWENARGWLWRSVLVGVCLVGLAGALTYFNDKDKWDYFSRSGGQSAVIPEGSGKGQEVAVANPDLGKRTEKPLENRPIDNLPETGKKDQVREKETKNGGIGTGQKGTDPKTDSNQGKGVVVAPPIKVQEKPPVGPIEAGQGLVGAVTGTPVDGLPVLLWAKGGELQKLKEGDAVSWGREIFVPPGFAGVVDSKAGWKACTFGNCAPLSGRELPLGTRFQLQAGLQPGKPSIQLIEGRLELIGALSGPEEQLLVKICGQDLKITSAGKFHLLFEAIPRLPRSEEVDWTLVVVQGSIRLLEHDSDSPVLMMAPPGLFQAKHSPSSGVSMEKGTRIPRGLQAESIKTMVRFREFSAAANEIVTGAKDKLFDPVELDRQFALPSANLAKKTLLVFLAGWLDDVKLPLKALNDNRASMKEMREGAVHVLGQMARDRRAAWEKAFLAPAVGSAAPVEATAPGEAETFRRFVEAIGRGEFAPPLVEKGMDFLVDGKSLAMREVAYQYLRMVNSPDEGPRYDPAEPENARKLSQKEWRRLVKGEMGN